MTKTGLEGEADTRRRMRSSDIVIDDERLSLSAKGVFVTVTLLGNGCLVDEVAGRCRDGAGSVDSALDELVRLRYVRVDAGRILLEEPPHFGIPGA